MLIAFIVILLLFACFVIMTYFIMRKTFKFKVGKREVLIKNAGAYIKVYVDKKLNKSFYMPNLIQGESYFFNIDNIEYNLKCKSNSFGSKLQMLVYEKDNLIADNGVRL